MSFEQFIEKLSKDMELDEPLQPQIPGVYTIPLDEGYSISLSNPSPDRHTLSSTLGEVPAAEREAFFTQLLLANLFGQGTKGALLGLDAEGNLLTLTQTIDYHIEYKDFRDIVEDFISTADMWREKTLKS